jgi:hypothetical protein
MGKPRLEVLAASGLGSCCRPGHSSLSVIEKAEILTQNQFHRPVNFAGLVFFMDGFD